MGSNKTQGMDRKRGQSKRHSLNQEGDIPIILDSEEVIVPEPQVPSISSKYSRQGPIGARFQQSSYTNGEASSAAARSALPRDAPHDSQTEENAVISSTPAFSTVTEHHTPKNRLSTTLAATRSTERNILVGADQTLNGSFAKYRRKSKAATEPPKQAIKQEAIARKHIASYYKHNEAPPQTNGSDQDESQAESIGFPKVIKAPVILTSRSSSVDFERKSDRSMDRSGDKSGRKPRLFKPTAGPTTRPDTRNMSPTLEEQSDSTDTSSVGRIVRLMHVNLGKTQGVVEVSSSYLIPEGVSFCWIDPDTGALLASLDASKQSPKTIIPDLRGCRIWAERGLSTQAPVVMLFNRHSGQELCLRPLEAGAVDEWLAAFLCWLPIKPRGVGNKLPRSQSPVTLADKPVSEKRRGSDVKSNRPTNLVMKPTKAMLWDARSFAENTGIRKASAGGWRPVSCLLMESGELQIKTDPDQAIVHQLLLTTFQRCAIQQLHPSVLDQDNCIAIYPQYCTTSLSHKASAVFLSFESKQAFEISFVCYRAFTMPEVYGPPESMESPLRSGNVFDTSLRNLFRIEQCLQMRIIQGRFLLPGPHSSDGASGLNKLRRGVSHDRPVVQRDGSTTAELWIDGEVRGRTAHKPETVSPYWREDFELHNLPPVLTNISVFVRQTESALIPLGREKFPEPPVSRHADGSVVKRAAHMSMDDGPPRYIMGICDLDLSKAEYRKDVERWFPLRDPRNDNIGEINLRIKLAHFVVLMSQDYDGLAGLLHDFNSGLTLQISQRCTAQLPQLSVILLDIFQSSGKAADWLMALIEEEVDGLHREREPSRWRYNKRVDSSDSHESGSERENHVRDFSRVAASEANLLFRGNTILTKSLDSFMRRIGKDYLEETIGDAMRKICAEDVPLEVDPSRLSAKERLESNWRQLIALTEMIWVQIVNSAPRCPPEFRNVFRHVRSCVEDRYGDHLRTVTYSSVSGFIFLRFFVPAILNPKLFDLTPNYPEPNANRTCTLLAKNIQGLANLTTFGTKEPWMARMNKFLLSRRQEFKDFIDRICELPEGPNNSRRPSTVAGVTMKTRSGSPHPSSTLTVPIAYERVSALHNRLPPVSREGFPSLPHLIDTPRAYAALVKLWIESGARDRLVESISTTPKDQRSPKNSGTMAALPGPDLIRFNALCQEIQEKVEYRVDIAQQAEVPSKVLSSDQQWDEARENVKMSLYGHQGDLVDSPTGISSSVTLRGFSNEYPPLGSRGNMLRPFSRRGSAQGGPATSHGGHHASNSMSGAALNAITRPGRAKTLDPSKSSTQVHEQSGPSSRLGSSCGLNSSMAGSNTGSMSSNGPLFKEVKYGGGLFAGDSTDLSTNSGLTSSLSRGASRLGISDLMVGFGLGKKKPRTPVPMEEQQQHPPHRPSQSDEQADLPLPLNSPPPPYVPKGRGGGLVGTGIGKGAWEDKTYTKFTRE